MASIGSLSEPRSLVLTERDLLPIPVRLNRPGLTPLAVVAEALEHTCLDQGIAYTPPEAPDLWTLKSAAPWRGEALQTPVLVLDQVEEVFTLHDPAVSSDIRN